MFDCRYDKSKSAVRLAQIIGELSDSEARKYGAKVGSITHDCHLVLKEFDGILDKRVFEMMWQAWYSEMMKRIDECIIPKTIHNHLKGTVKTILRNYRRNYLIYHPETKVEVRRELVTSMMKYSMEFNRFSKQENDDGPKGTF